MVRRAHRKSRNGCLECKRRHVKCDERRPICSHCSITERACEYRSPRIPTVEETPSPPSPPSTTTSQPTPPTPINLHETTSPQEPPANLLHLQLLHNFTTSTSHSLTTPSFTPNITTLSLSTPYLANELLALSALHISATQPPHRKTYHHHAAQLQTHALAAFNATPDLVPITEDTCAPLLLFSSCLGLHALCDTLVFRDHPGRDTDFGHFIARFVRYLRLHHGVRAVTGSAWSMLRASVLSPLLDGSAALFDWNGGGGGDSNDDSNNLAPPFHHLWDRITARRLGADSTRVYHQAIQALQVAANASRISVDDDIPTPAPIPNNGNINANSDSDTERERGSQQKEKTNPTGIIAWPVLVSPSYIDLLMHGRPEALVILACYGALLHRFSELWIFGDGGRFLIESVGEFLGSEWEGWLGWPRDVLLRY
ncbi:hypothetical protein P168DRAFT_308406 [Aspergillus campestris IBT 28561]|uniref:Zn(2)-C6 fungal-type domain-containing protein n=1 Tax=Aspergillus campestris (strain IBT 28561) TaxID=1392248 RepID=A0A2I1DEQ8_ASPC2|nr:uncharacterized protein P168DRAFT_308406 [Aspergillus campestris IBT 28561]PKY08354.1 hypothetical protein P168DRAFT_308406 [Aspergillus campestris IBT 28561]